jgi:hypothetical protein
MKLPAISRQNARPLRGSQALIEDRGSGIVIGKAILVDLTTAKGPSQLSRCLFSLKTV